MSQAVKAAMLASKGLGKNERNVLVAIAAHQNSKGDAWPSVATIAEYADCSERTVQRCIAKLVTMGRLAWRMVAGIATRVYRIITGQGATPDAAGVTDQRPGVPETGAGGDSHDRHPKLEDHPEEGRPGVRAGGRLDWRRYIPRRDTTPQQQRPSYPQRRGAALPPAPGTGQCTRHRGSPAGNCGPCRSEQIERTR